MIIIFKLIFLIYFLFKFNGIIKSRKEIFQQQIKIILNNLEKNGKDKIKDFEYILNYKGGALEPEWEWVKNISFVYTWVDGSDINLANIKSIYNGGNKEVNSRDRSADELQYSLRSLKKYLPWHNGIIFIVTDNQIPKWLDINNNQIKIISHEEIIPKYINPTFDSSTIECFLDNIPEISDIFIYLNDDFFFNNFVHPSFFFSSSKFEPKIYRTNLEIFDKEKVENFIKENDIHHIYDASAYFTYKIIYEYFDHNYTYYHLAHSAYVCYCSFFKVFRHFFEEELKVVFSHRFRSPYKPITLYLYQILLLYLNKKLEFASSAIYEKKLFDFRKRYLEKNYIMSNYSFELIPEEITNLFVKFSFIKDNSKSNYNNFKYLTTNKNILIYNLNDKYNSKKALYEFTEYMITRYVNNNTFEKTKYVNLEKEYLDKLQYVNDIIKSNDDYPNDKKINKYLHKMLFNKKNLNNIKEYLKERNKLSYNQNISLMEKDELEILFDYDGRELEPNWEWVKNISIVYIITENKYKIINKLKYSLRSIERYLPWFFGTIFIIVQNISYNLEWLNKNNLHIKIIDPKNIVSTKINGNYTREIIEMFLDKIPSISERFILFNQDHYFKHFIHPIFFFNKNFFPKYNYDYGSEQKIQNNISESIFKTFELIQKIFGVNYVNNYRLLIYSPIPLYRDLFKPVRKLYLSKILESNNKAFILLPLYLLSTYNIYGASQIYYPDYVAGFGEIRSLPSPTLNINRTISYYGFDITSEFILKKTILNVDLFQDVKRKIEELENSNALFFSLKLKNNIDEYELKLINIFFQKLFPNKSIFEC